MFGFLNSSFAYMSGNKLLPHLVVFSIQFVHQTVLAAVAVVA